MSRLVYNYCMKHYVLFICILLNIAYNCDAQKDTIVLTNAIVIDGTGSKPQQNANIWLHDSTIVAITKGKIARSATLRTIDMTGKTIMPALISAHAHIGTLKDT